LCVGLRVPVNGTLREPPEIAVAKQVHSARTRDGRHQMTSNQYLACTGGSDGEHRSNGLTLQVPCAPLPARTPQLGGTRLPRPSGVPQGSAGKAGERSGLLDAHRRDEKRFIVRANEKLSAFLELESAISACGEFI
jgi:hypothetical protein